MPGTTIWQCFASLLTVGVIYALPTANGGEVSGSRGDVGGIGIGRCRRRIAGDEWWEKD